MLPKEPKASDLFMEMSPLTPFFSNHSLNREIVSAFFNASFVLILFKWVVGIEMGWYSFTTVR